MVIYGLDFAEQRGYRLESHTHGYIHAVAQAALYASGVVGEGVGPACGMVIVPVVKHLAAAVGAALESHAELHAFDCIDAEHGSPEGDIELVKYGLAQSGRCSRDDTCDHAAYSIALFSDFHNQIFHLRGHLRVGAADRVALYDRHVKLVVGSIKLQRTYRARVCCHIDAGL